MASNKNLSIRTLKEQHIDRASDIVATHDPEHAVLARRDLLSHFQGNYLPGSFFIGAFLDDELVGLMGLYDDPDEDVKNICWAVWLYVDSSYRNIGAGRLLHDGIVKEAKSRKARKLYLDVGNENDHESALRMYDKIGYKQEGALMDYFEPGEHKLIYALDLSQYVLL